MSWRRLRLPVIVLILLIQQVGAESEDQGKGEGGAPQPQAQREFVQKTSRLNSLTTRIAEDEKQFQELVNKKASEKDEAEKQRIIKEMVTVTADRNKSADEFNKLKTDLSLRYPGQGEHLERNYRTQNKRSVEDMEGAAGLDELLTRTKKVIEKKFAPFNPDDEKDVKKTKIAEPVEEDRAAPLRLEK